MRVGLSEGLFEYENFLVTLGRGGRSRVNFSGSVGVDGRVDLLATIPRTESGLVAGSWQVVVGGTVTPRTAAAPGSA